MRVHLFAKNQMGDYSRREFYQYLTLDFAFLCAIILNMDELRIGYFSATQKEDPTATSILQSMNNLGGDFYVAFALNNKEPLAKVYNRAIDKALDAGYDCLVLLHDDLWLAHDPKPNLTRLFKIYDLVGVAGCSRAEIKTPTLWHLMGGKDLHGAVAHGTPTNQRMTSFGPYPHRVVMIDGVFMALSRKVMENVRFDEDCPSPFHHYDLNYSYSCHIQGYKVGVGDIYVTHESPGLSSYTPEWDAGDAYFLNKYGK